MSRRVETIRIVPWSTEASVSIPIAKATLSWALRNHDGVTL